MKDQMASPPSGSDVEQRVAEERQLCAWIAEYFEAPYYRDHPGEKVEHELQHVVLQALFNAPRDNPQDEPETFVAQEVMRFLLQGRERPTWEGSGPSCASRVIAMPNRDEWIAEARARLARYGLSAGTEPKATPPHHNDGATP